MLRRRIFSAAMASVMALSSVAVVAQAAETTNQVKTKADLEELVTKTYGASYRADELDNYGKTSASNMLDALEAAEAILEDADSDDADYTAAYMMVVACEARLTQHSLEDLKALLKSAQAELDRNNIFNEELQDQIYVSKYFTALEEAVDEANSYLTSKSASDIADAYDELETAYNDLLANANKKVSKSQFRNVLKDYEAILAEKTSYDMWRRGTAPTWYGITSGQDWQFMSDHTSAAFGAFYDYCADMQEDIKKAYDMIDEIKGLTVTTDADIVDGYNMASDLVKMFKSWSADSSSKATKSGVKALLDKYHGQLVYQYNTIGVNDLVSAVTHNNTLTVINDYADLAENGTAYSFSGGFWTDGNHEAGDVVYAADMMGWTSTIYAYYIVSDTVTNGGAADVKYAAVNTDDIVVIADDAEGNKATAADITLDMVKGYDVYGEKFGYEVVASFYHDGNKETTFVLKRTVVELAATANSIKLNNSTGWSTNYATVKGYQGKETNRLIQADYIIKPDTTLYIPLDNNGYWDQSRAILTDKTKRDNGKYQTVSKGSKFDLSDLIAVDATMVNTDLNLKDNTTLDNLGEAHPWGGEQISVYDTDREDDYYVQLDSAMYLAEAYLAGNEEDDYARSLMTSYDNTGLTERDDLGKSVLNVKSGKEWALVYRALEYALTDRYEGVAQGEYYTMDDVKALIEDAYELVEETGDAAIFNDTNVALVTARQNAIEWIATANADKLYKDGVAGKGADGVYVSSTTAYKALKDAYDALSKEYDALKYSFGDIYEKLADTADRIDGGDLDATDALLTAMDEVAYRLSVVADVITTSDNDEYEDNYAFDMDAKFNPNNRVITNTGDAQNIKTIATELEVGTAAVTTKDDANPTHAALATAYNALLDAIKAQAEPEVVLGDANGDGKVNAADAAAIAKYAVGLGTVDEKAADYNKDGKVNVADAAAIIKAIVAAN